MVKNYYDRREKLKEEMFMVSIGLKDLFDYAINCDDKKDVENIIKSIKKIQKKSYKIIEKSQLSDYHGGTYACYPGGGIDTYQSQTDKQDVLDLIDYFFINTCSSADEFNKNISPKLHDHEHGESYGLFDYSVDKEPKKFYDAKCWEQILRRKAIDLVSLADNGQLSQEEIDEINQEYGA